MSSLFALIWLAILPALGGGELEQAIARFRQSLGPMGAERTQALSQLVALGDPGATPVLADEFARCSAALRKAADEVTEARHALEHRQKMLADLEQRKQGDPSLESYLTSRREAVEAMSKELAKLDKVIAREAPWHAELSAATAKFFDVLGDSRRKTAEKLLWEDATRLPDPQARLGAIEMLARGGGHGTAVEMVDLLGSFVARKAELERKLPKAEEEVHKLEKRMQREAEQLGGRTPESTQHEYDRARAEAAGMRRELTLLCHLSDSAVEAASRALAREATETQVRSVQALGRELEREKGELRLRILAILAGVDVDSVKAEVRERLESEKEPAAIARILTDLAALGDSQIVEPILSRWLDHETLLVQAAALDALVSLKSVEAIDPLIDRLEPTQGRARTDLQRALIALTGKDFRNNQLLWKRWWEENREGFVVPEVVPPRTGDAHAMEGTYVVTFFGIETESKHVLFILDVSGSMNFAMVARDNPSDDPGKPHDMPLEGESSRLDTAKRDLVHAVDGLEDGSTCNLVVYASDVWSWQDQPVVLDTEKRAELHTYIEGLEGVGGTNIFGALEMAFELAGVEGKAEWERPEFDTIFLLSDGRPSVGVTTNIDEILAFVREKNRSAGIVIHTIGLSGAHNAHLMRSLAEENGGTYASH